MKKSTFSVIAILILVASCTSTKKLSYLSNLPETSGDQFFTMEIPDYKIQNRDILYITLKAMTPDGSINDFLLGRSAIGGGYYMQGESGAYLYGYDVNGEGKITLPVIGSINVAGKTLEEIRKTLQEEFNKSFKNTTVECKLLSFKFTVIGEVRTPGTYVNYNNYLTVLEAIGRAGGIGDYGNRNRVLVVRPVEKGTKTYRLNLQDKNILSSEAYFLLPNDVVIIEPHGNKIFNMNLPTISFILTSVTSTISMLILILSYTK
jgi:polysaccharide biosynthesis/export protein